MSIDFRQCLYALSDVIINRPLPLRIYDQIYMKLPDMLLQAELISRWFDKQRVMFIGDGDAIGLTCAHLSENMLLPGKPEFIQILDFDERVVNSIKNFAHHYNLEQRIDAELYNVADALPKNHWNKYDAFYTNPPWGASNDGKSVSAFIKRGIESVVSTSKCCIVIGDHKDFRWTGEIINVTQKIMLKHGFRVAEMLPEFHRYHLDDNPDLTSCSIVFCRNDNKHCNYISKPLSVEDRANFYGRNAPLKAHYIRDLTIGGKLPSHDINVEPIV